MDPALRPLLEEALREERRGNSARAEAAYRLVLMRDPTVLLAVLGLSRVLWSQGDAVGAERLLASLPSEPEAVAFRARLLEEREPEEALRLYRRLETLDLGSPEPYLQQARLLAASDAEATMAALGTWLQLVDGAPSLQDLVDISLALKSQGALEEALQVLSDTKERWPESDDLMELEALQDRIAVEQQAERLAVGGAVPLDPLQALLVEDARRAVIDGDLDGALDTLLKVVARSPHAAEAWAAQGDVQQAKGQIAEAESAYLLAVALSPDEPSYHVRLGMLLAQRYGGRRHREAESELNTALGLRPSWHELYYRLGLVRQDAGDFEGAVAAFDAYLEQAVAGPERSDAAQRLTDLTRQRPALPALPAPEPSDDIPAEAWRRYRVARVYRDRGDLETAESELGLALQEAPLFLEAHLFRAALAMERGQPDEAIGAYQETLKLHPEHPRVLLALGEIYRQQAQPSLATPYLQRAAQAGSAEAWYFLATMALDAGELLEAQRLLDAYFASSTGGLVHQPAELLREQVTNTLRWYRGAGGLLLALLLLAPAGWLLRRRTGADLQRLLSEAPDSYQEVARLLSSIRHEVLKHNTTLLATVADRIEAGEQDAALYASERLFGLRTDAAHSPGPQDRPLVGRGGVVQQFEGYIQELEMLGRRYGLRLNLRRRDPVLAPMYRAMTRLKRLEPRLRRPQRGQATRLTADLRELSTSLNEEGYQAIGALVQSMFLLHLEPGFFKGVYERVASEPEIQGEAPTVLHIEWLESSLYVRIFRNDLDDLTANLFRNALNVLRDELPLTERRIGVRLDEEMDPITGLEHVAIRFLDNAPRPLTEAILRGSRIERGLGLAADLLARHQGVMSVESEPGWAKAVVVRLPRAEPPEPTIEASPGDHRGSGGER